MPRSRPSPKTNSQDVAHSESAPVSLDQELLEFARNLQRLEFLSRRVDQLLVSVSGVRVLEKHMKKLAAELSGIRAKHDLRRRLFEPLREELIKYRDAFAREVLQKTLVQDLTRLDDDLRNVLDCIKRAAEVKRGRIANWARGFDCSIESLTGILGRLEVSEIEPIRKVNPTFHRVVSAEPTENLKDDGKIVARVKRGLLWRDQVLRREDVIAKRYH